jgi:16S rRNA (guanine527-N7)-methyltransferase
MIKEGNPGKWACIIRDMELLKRAALEQFGIRLDNHHLDALRRYEEMLVAWSAVHNLTAIHEPDDIRIRHFLDSLSCVLALRGTRPGRLVDVGVGAGFPGLVLKILYPSMPITLVESVSKKMEFCRLVVAELGLEQVTFLTARAEEIGRMPEHRAAYDWAVARAVAVMPVLVEYLLPLARLGGKMLAMKGENAPAETRSAESASHLLGGRLNQLIPVTLPGVTEQRYLVIFDKCAATPDAYPRRTGIPSKRPLGNK